MKTMTCNQLGGACEKEFQAESFHEMAKKSQEHGKEMAEKGDKDHLKAMEKMRGNSQEEMNEWMEEKKTQFEKMPED